MISMVACVKGMTSKIFAKLLNEKTTKGPKVVMSYQKSSRGKNANGR